MNNITIPRNDDSHRPSGHHTCAERYFTLIGDITFHFYSFRLCTVHRDLLNCRRKDHWTVPKYLSQKSSPWDRTRTEERACVHMTAI